MLSKAREYSIWQIIATMLANGIQRIYTFNPGDFQVFAELTVVAPT